MNKEIRDEMCSEGIFINPVLRRKINSISEDELQKRWTGIIELAGRRHDLTNRPGWMARMMWTRTALCVGGRIRREMEAAQAKRQTELMAARTAENIRIENQKISEAAWQEWQNCPDKLRLVEQYLETRDAFFIEYFKSHFMTWPNTIEDMSRNDVITWLSACLV